MTNQQGHAACRPAYKEPLLKAQKLTIGLWMKAVVCKFRLHRSVNNNRAARGYEHTLRKMREFQLTTNSINKEKTFLTYWNFALLQSRHLLLCRVYLLNNDENTHPQHCIMHEKAGTKTNCFHIKNVFYVYKYNYKKNHYLSGLTILH